MKASATLSSGHTSKLRWPLFCGAYAFSDPIPTIGEQITQKDFDATGSEIKTYSQKPVTCILIYEVFSTNGLAALGTLFSRKPVYI